MHSFCPLVVILSVRGSLVREFLLAAHKLGMTRGDWAFVDVEIFQVRSDTRIVTRHGNGQ